MRKVLPHIEDGRLISFGALAYIDCRQQLAVWLISEIHPRLPPKAGVSSATAFT